MSEMQQTLDGIAQRIKEKKALYYERDDANYYLVFVFQNQQERDALVNAAGWDKKIDDVFLNGKLLKEVIIHV